ncbi:MAG: hypothetical protein ACYCPN_05065 [Thermoplasmata archaeon]
MAGRPITSVWRLNATDEFREDVKRACGKDGALRSRVEKKVRKITEDPDHIGEWKSGALRGLKSEYVNPNVILFNIERTPDNPPGAAPSRRVSRAPSAGSLAAPARPCRG